MTALASLAVTISTIGANSARAQNMTDMSTTNMTGTNHTSDASTDESCNISAIRRVFRAP